MNCDQAFDCLTDSRRRHSAELERHLAACPRCRQMHDTLEPALDLFDCVVEEPDLSGLARERRATGQPESLRVAEQTAARLFAAENPGRPRSDWSGFLRYTTVFVCGAVVVLALGAAQQRFGPESAPRAARCQYWAEEPGRWRGVTPQAAMSECQKCHAYEATRVDNDAAGAVRGEGAPFRQVSRTDRATSLWLALAESLRLPHGRPPRDRSRSQTDVVMSTPASRAATVRVPQVPPTGGPVLLVKTGTERSSIDQRTSRSEHIRAARLERLAPRSCFDRADSARTHQFDAVDSSRIPPDAQRIESALKFA
jgi:hypothetical protein